MDITGSETILAPVDAVWRALNDPGLLKQCIPGCEALDWTSDTTLNATLMVKFGLIKVRFEGTIELSNLKPPHSYTIAAQGKGGLMGFAKGSADVTLTEKGPDSTVLTYVAGGDVGGKIAQLGSRLVGSVTSKLAEHFFAKLSAKAAESFA